MPSNPDQLLQIAQSRFSASSAATDSIYAKAGAVGTLAVVLSAAGYSLLDAERIVECASGVIVFLYSVSALVLLFLLAFLWAWLAAALVPKTEYKDLIPLNSYLDKHKIDLIGPECDLSKLKLDMLHKLIQADEVNCKINERRMKCIRVAARLAIYSALVLMSLGIFDFVLTAME